MGKLVVSEFITLDGIIENPGGSEDTKDGGWSFRHPAPMASRPSSTSCVPLMFSYWAA